ncbi:hypothetical protein JTB14_035482 [Gonioctena quinquepunctata]|nr:hypothetical protein JTB14_035482 [Gonioctena quinquepunctata]
MGRIIPRIWDTETNRLYEQHLEDKVPSLQKIFDFMNPLAMRSLLRAFHNEPTKVKIVRCGRDFGTKQNQNRTTHHTIAEEENNSNKKEVL